MPYETVQFGRVDDATPTEVSVHWTRNSHVQIKTKRHDLAVPIMITPADEDEITDTPTLSTASGQPRTIEPLPVGTVKAADGQIAYKTRGINIVRDGNVFLGHPEWTVLRLCGSVEKCTEDQIHDWPIVHYPDDRPVAAEIYTHVLQRTEINRLIRVLRKARDDAYGRDE